jgi:RNA polymerase sigma factor (sigma-70 family)
VHRSFLFRYSGDALALASLVWRDNAMADSSATHPSLLIRIRDVRDDVAWTLFTDVYVPLIVGFLCKRGLQEHDAADLAQDVLIAVAQAMRRFEYDPRRGTFRGWLFTVVQNRLRNFLAARQRHVQGTGDTAMQERLNQQPDREEDQASQWDRAYEQQLFAWASEQVRPRVTEHNFQAFWRTAVEGQSTQVVAAQLGLSVAAVRLAKSRVMAHIRRQIEEMEAE